MINDMDAPKEEKELRGLPRSIQILENSTRKLISVVDTLEEYLKPVSVDADEKIPGTGHVREDTGSIYTRQLLGIDDNVSSTANKLQALMERLDI